jgi:hypothetical protein
MDNYPERDVTLGEVSDAFGECMAEVAKSVIILFLLGVIFLTGLYILDYFGFVSAIDVLNSL